jgi:hypothetical protein
MDASTLKPQNTSELIQTNAALWWAATRGGHKLHPSAVFLKKSLKIGSV